MSRSARKTRQLAKFPGWVRSAANIGYIGKERKAAAAFSAGRRGARRTRPAAASRLLPGAAAIGGDPVRHAES